MGYEGGNVPKEMADCAMADILSTFRRAAFVFVGSKEKKNERTVFVSFSCVFCVFFWGSTFRGREFLIEERERRKRQ